MVYVKGFCDGQFGDQRCPFRSTLVVINSDFSISRYCEIHRPYDIRYEIRIDKNGEEHGEWVAHDRV